jgi:hypothetical protein
VNAQSADLSSLAALIVNIHDHSLQHNVILSDFELARKLSEKTVDHDLPFYADDGVEGTAHPEIRDISRSVWQDPLVGGLNVRVRAENGGGPAIEIPAHGVFLRGRLSMHIDNNDARVLPVLLENPINGPKWVIHMIGHKDSALNIDDQRS